MGNLCSTASGGEARSFSDVLRDTFPGTTPVLPWRADLKLLSVVAKTREAPRYSLIGSLHDFVSVDQQGELKQLRTEFNAASVLWGGQKIAQEIEYSHENLAKLFLTEPHGQASAQLAALTGSVGSVNLRIDEHGSKIVEDFSNDVLPSVVKLDLCLAKERLERLGIWGFRHFELFVVDRIIMARNVELEFVRDVQGSVDASVEATAIPLKAGLKLSHKRAKAGSYYLHSTETDPLDQRPVPFGIAFGCMRLVFDADGNRTKIRPYSGFGPAGKSTADIEQVDCERAEIDIQEDGYAHLEVMERPQQVDEGTTDQEVVYRTY